MKFWITFIFSFLAIQVATAGHRKLALKIKRNLKVGDEIIIKGRGNSSSPSSIRFEDTGSFCNGKTSAVNPLVLILRTRRRQLSIGKKTRDTRCRDGQFLPRHRVYEIQQGRIYTIKILITTNGYTIRVGNDNRYRSMHKETANSLASLDVIRARSGEYLSIQVKRNIHLPLASNCGVRQVASGIRTRISGGETSIAGNYPWQAAIRKKHYFDWNPLIHMCGGTLIDSCWILTAAHCTKRISGKEEDYYIRVGDYDNSNHSEPRQNEDEQDLDIDKVFIHEGYNQSTRDPVHDVSLIKLKDIAGTGICAITQSRYVTPACLPIVGTDEFTTNDTCEISGWGASAYRQNIGDYPIILKKGDVRIRDFDQCKGKFGNGTDGIPRIRKGMICAGGKADTCQGDSGGPLACQRNRAMPNSPFVIWGITSWGEKCASKDKPGVYTEVSDYMRWIKNTISMNID